MRTTKIMTRTTRFLILVVLRLPSFGSNFATLNNYIQSIKGEVSKSRAQVPWNPRSRPWFVIALLWGWSISCQRTDCSISTRIPNLPKTSCWYLLPKSDPCQGRHREFGNCVLKLCLNIKDTLVLRYLPQIFHFFLIYCICLPIKFYNH